MTCIKKYEHSSFVFDTTTTKFSGSKNSESQWIYLVLVGNFVVEAADSVVAVRFLLLNLLDCCEEKES